MMTLIDFGQESTERLNSVAHDIDIHCCASGLRSKAGEG